jgi:hypothetical protein
MLERLAPKLLSEFDDIELLEHIGKPLHPKSIPLFDEFCDNLFDEHENFHGTANEYIELLVTHLNRTFKKFVSLGGFTRSRARSLPQQETCIPEYFSSSDRFLFVNIIEKLTDPHLFALLVKPLPMVAESMFVEVRRNAFIELKNFDGTACAYFLLQLMRVHTALAEVIALHKYKLVPKV